MLEKCELQSIISLPTGVFLPYTGVKTNVVYLKKVNKKSTKNHYWNFDVKNDGYSLDNNRRKLEGESDLEKYLSNRNPDTENKSESFNIGFDIINIEDVIKNDYILIGSQYKELYNHDNVKFELVKLKDVVKILSGFPFNSQNFSPTEGFPIIRIRDIKTNNTDTKYNGEYKPEYIIKNGDLIVGMDGDFNHVIWKGGDALLNQRICKIYDFKNCLKEYIFEIIRKPLKIIWENTPYTTVKHISIKQILDITIPLPPIDIQTEIVNKLTENKKMIANAKRKIEELEKQNSLEIGEIWGD